MTTHKSEVAHFREQQALEEQASRFGLYGPAIVVNHNSITARLQQGAERITRLMQQGKMQEAAQLMEQPDWGADMQETQPETQDTQGE
jgi:hypothetical protein